MNRILIIDGMNSAYRAFHSYHGMKSREMQETSIIYGMPMLINALINQLKPDDIHICWDGSKSKHRMKLLPTYKAGRKTRTDEERDSFYKQVEVTRNLFHYLGIKQIHHPDVECDDFIYMMVRKLQKKNKITIVSTDKDFHQLIKGNVKVYNTAKRLLIHRKNLQREYGYTPKQCVDYLCLVGDDSDNISGYRGVGPATAVKFLNECSSIKEFLSSEKTFGRIDKVKLASLYSLNRQLIDLRYFYKKFLKGKIKPKYWLNNPEPKLLKKALFRICDEYSIRSIKEKRFLINYM